MSYLFWTLILAFTACIQCTVHNNLLLPNQATPKGLIKINEFGFFSSVNISIGDSTFGRVILSTVGSSTMIPDRAILLNKTTNQTQQYPFAFWNQALPSIEAKSIETQFYTTIDYTQMTEQMCLKNDT